MEILTHKIESKYIIKLRGELDANNSESVEKILDEIVKLNPEQIQIDCLELKYISSRGLGVFISRFQEIQNKKISFYLCNLSSPVHYVFNVLGLDDIIEIRTDNRMTA